MQLVRRYSSLQDVHIGFGGMAPHKLRKATAIIDDHLNGEQEGRVPLRAVADEVGMSYFHFSRAFKKSMGMSPTNYIAERRIERAKGLLNETHLPISEIALRSGFSRPESFYKLFSQGSRVYTKRFQSDHLSLNSRLPPKANHAPLLTNCSSPLLFKLCPHAGYEDRSTSSRFLRSRGGVDS